MAADFSVNVDGVDYATRDEAIAAVREAWDSWKQDNADPRARSTDPAEYLQFKSEVRPPDYEPTEAEREVFEANLASALERQAAAGD